MKLSNIALREIRNYSPGIKSKLALALNCSEASINRYIRDNHDNLTKAAAVRVIREETGLREKDLLIE